MDSKTNRPGFNFSIVLSPSLFTGIIKACTLKKNTSPAHTSMLFLKNITFKYLWITNNSVQCGVFFYPPFLSQNFQNEGIKRDQAHC